MRDPTAGQFSRRVSPRTHPSSQGHRNPRTGLDAALENSPDGSMPVMRWRRSSSAAGTVALADRRSCGILVERAVWSDRQQEFVECGSQPQTRNRVGSEFVVTTSQVLNERMPSDHETRGPVCLQPAHRPKPGFEPAVITLAPVVLILPSVMERRRDQLIDHVSQRRCTVGARSGRWRGTVSPQRYPACGTRTHQSPDRAGLWPATRTAPGR